MFRPSRKLFWTGLAILMLVASVSMSQAQGAFSSKMVSQTATPAALGPTSIQPQTLPDIVALSASITDEQRQALRAVVEAHKAEIEAVFKDEPMPQVNDSTASGKYRTFLPDVITGSNTASVDIAALVRQKKAPALSNGTTVQSGDNAALIAQAQDTLVKFQGYSTQLDAIQAKMNTEFAAILTSDQMAQYNAVLDLGKTTPLSTNPTSQATIQFVDDYCYATAVYAAIANVYFLNAYINASYEYTFYPTAYSLAAYNYFAASRQQAINSNIETGGGFFSIRTLRVDLYNQMSYGIADAYNANGNGAVGVNNSAYQFRFVSGSGYALAANNFGATGVVYAGAAYNYGNVCYQ